MNESLNSSFDFAISSMIVANTPLYLVNELRKSPDVRRAALTIPPDNLRRNLRSAIKRDPKTTKSEVAPYLYIVIAGLQNNNKLLNDVKSMTQGNHKWLPRILDYVIKTTSSISSQSFDLAGVHQSVAKPSSSFDPSNNYNSIDIGASR